MPEWTPRLEANVLLDFEGELRNLAAYEAYGGYAQLKRALDGMDADTLIADLIAILASLDPNMGDCDR